MSNQRELHHPLGGSLVVTWILVSLQRPAILIEGWLSFIEQVVCNSGRSSGMCDHPCVKLLNHGHHAVALAREASLVFRIGMVLRMSSQYVVY